MKPARIITVIVVTCLALCVSVQAQERKSLAEAAREAREQAEQAKKAKQQTAARKADSQGQAGEAAPAKATGNERSDILAAATAKSEDGKARIVITNDVLEKVFGPASPPPNAPVYEKALQAAQQTGASGPRTEKVAVQAPGGIVTHSGRHQGGDEARIQEIESELDRLRKRLIGMRNPYLPRGKATEEEREQERGQDNVARVRSIEEKILTLEQELLRIRGSGAGR